MISTPPGPFAGLLRRHISAGHDHDDDKVCVPQTVIRVGEDRCKTTSEYGNAIFAMRHLATTSTRTFKSYDYHRVLVVVVVNRLIHNKLRILGRNSPE